MSRARVIYSQLVSSPVVITALLPKISEPLLTWAPENPNQALKVAAAYRELQNKGQGPQSLSLLVKFDPYPSCSEAHHIIDIWQHPLQGHKLKGFVRDVTLVQPPALMVVSGKHAPMHVRKGLAIFTLGTVATPVIATLKCWHETLFQFSYAQSIWIDVLRQYR